MKSLVTKGLSLFALTGLLFAGVPSAEALTITSTVLERKTNVWTNNGMVRYTRASTPYNYGDSSSRVGRYYRRTPSG